MVVEKAFGVLKRRFPSLNFGLRLDDPLDDLLLINCALILHNICILRDDVIDFANENDVTEVQISSESDYWDIAGEEVRNAMVDLFVTSGLS